MSSPNNSGKERQRERKKKRGRHLHVVPEQQKPETDRGEVLSESPAHFSPGMKFMVRIVLTLIGGIGLAVLVVILHGK